LSLVIKGLSPPSFLDTYTRERLPIIASMLNKTTELFHKALSPTGGLGRGWQRGYELKQFGVNYRGSPLVLDEIYGDGNGREERELADHYRAGEDGSVHAGDRAPDAPDLLPLPVPGQSIVTEITTRFFDIFKPHCHTVLVYCGSRRDVEGWQELLRTLSEYHAGIIQTVFVFPQNATGVPSMMITGKIDFVLLDQGGHAYKNFVVDESEGGIIIIRPDGWIGALVKDVAVDGIKKYFDNIFA
jgi:hypothetical protein